MRVEIIHTDGTVVTFTRVQSYRTGVYKDAHNLDVDIPLIHITTWDVPDAREDSVYIPEQDVDRVLIS